MSSLAGRVSTPKLPSGTVRIGGFGGISGLKEYLRENKVDVLIDATHPFASRMSRNAETACQELELPLLAYARPQWCRMDGDHWDEVSSFKAAAELIDLRGGRVFLAIGRQEVAAFAACNHASFIIRSIEMPSVLPPHTTVILGRGPFDFVEELKMLHDHGIEYIACKNSGGLATYGKIEAARSLGLPVIMIQRPKKHTVATNESLDALLSQFDIFLQTRDLNNTQKGSDV